MTGKDKPTFYAPHRMMLITFIMIGIIATGIFVCTLVLNQNHTATAQRQQQLSGIQSSNALVQEDEETAYLKFASQAVKQSSNSSATAATMQLPEATKGPPIPAKGYLVQQIKGGLYWLTDGAYQTMFMVTDKGVVAVDAPATIGNNYLKAIAEVTTKPVTYVIYSHAHIDHIGAAGIFPKNATFIAHQETAAELQRAKSIAKNASMVPRIPTVTFAKNYSLQIGNQSLKLNYYGVNHLPGNIFIYAPNQKSIAQVLIAERKFLCII